MVKLADNAIDVYRQPHGEGYAERRRFERGEKLAPERFPERLLEVSEIIP